MKKWWGAGILSCNPFVWYTGKKTVSLVFTSPFSKTVYHIHWYLQILILHVSTNKNRNPEFVINSALSVFIIKKNVDVLWIFIYVRSFGPKFNALRINMVDVHINLLQQVRCHSAQERVCLCNRDCKCAYECIYLTIIE